MKHTKGNWSSTGLEIRAQNSTIIATVYSHLPNNQSREEAEANAKLIAAAPELLEALKAIKEIGKFKADGQIGKIINNAINKAQS